MSVLTICRAGDPILRQNSQVVPENEIKTAEMQTLIKDMIETMHHTQGVGLAAPQVGVSQRIFVYGFEQNARYPKEKAVPLTIWINPEIIHHSKETQEGYEGCLSVAGLRGEVPRFQSLEIVGFNQLGEKLHRIIKGFEARIFQHEMDHLNGYFFIERISNFDHFGFTEVLSENKLI